MQNVSYSLVQKVSQKGSPYYVIRLVFGRVNGMEIAIEKFLNESERNMIVMIEEAKKAV